MTIVDAMTSHAEERLHERKIPPFIVDLLQQFGTTFRSFGADRIIFDKAAIVRLERHFGGHQGLRVIEPWLTAYAVIGDDGTIITLAYRTQRIRRKAQRTWRRTRPARRRVSSRRRP